MFFGGRNTGVRPRKTARRAFVRGAGRLGWLPGSCFTCTTAHLGEELDSWAEGVPHAEWLLRGIENGLGLTGVRAARAGPGTEKFLTVMIMRRLVAPSDRIGHLAGAAYAALEASAVPELESVLSVIDRFRVLRGRVGDDYDALVRFFDAHLVRWEPCHEAGLRSACRGHLDSIEVRKPFETGFRAVMASMDDWWRALAAESAERQEA